MREREKTWEETDMKTDEDGREGFSNIKKERLGGRRATQKA